MQLDRNLSLGDSGADVRYVKDRLFSLGYYSDDVKAIKKDSFGADTDDAVRAFQRVNRDADGKPLRVDGIVGKATIWALERAKPLSDAVTLPKNIGPTAANGIRKALAGVDVTRRALVLTALEFAFDAEAGKRKYPISLYIRGENLFDTKLRQVVITAARIEQGAKKQPQYYSGGRKEMMLKAAAENAKITGADCSGAIVGLFRRYGLVSPTFDQTANALCGSKYSKLVPKGELIPGDFVGRPGHIGVYAGGGYVVEWMGGAYGCQLSKLDNRRGYDFVNGRINAQSKWTRFRRPKAYP